MFAEKSLQSLIGDTEVQIFFGIHVIQFANYFIDFWEIIPLCLFYRIPSYM